MEPYREDKPWIRFNPDAMKQSILETILSIPGARAIKYYHDNPEGSATETLALLAEDLVPFYGNYRNDGDWSDYAKEAAMLGVPMPYIRHPKTGAQIPNNLKEGLGSKGWSTTKYGWKHNIRPRTLYKDVEDMPHTSSPILRGSEEGLSTRYRDNSARLRNTPNTVHGPFRNTDTGSNMLGEGGQITNTNTVPTVDIVGVRPREDHIYRGTDGWAGDMYPAGRRLRNDYEYGPFQWEDKYTRKLDNTINNNETQWEFLINKTRATPDVRVSVTPKEDIVSIALEQGRPDIAQRVLEDQEPRLPTRDRNIARFNTKQITAKLDDRTFKDAGNRAVEKELRERFATLPEDDAIRYRFAEHYGTPDLYNDWVNNPDKWKEYTDYVNKLRGNRSRNNRFRDRQAGRNIQR